tara:strand:+ start:190 stop:465 length:276 start_codon:yes stop_codon:yes gene_type:complete
MKLFLVHTGFYDNTISNGFYESQTNYFVVANHEKDAKIRVKILEEFKKKKMHIDGILEFNSIGNYKILLKRMNMDEIKTNKHFNYDDIKKI